MLKKLKYYKKAMHNFAIYMITFAVIGMLLMPVYSSLYETLRQGVIEGVNDKVHKEINIIENEVNMQINMVKNITMEKDFKILSNPIAYGYFTTDAAWFESRENVRKAYSSVKSVTYIQDRSFLLFKNSDTQIYSSGALDEFGASYDTLWRLTVEGGQCSIDAANTQLFSKKHVGHFDSSIGYEDIASGNNYELVYLHTLTTTATEEALENDSIFVACYDAEDLVERFGLGDKVLSVMIADENGKKIYSGDANLDMSEYDSAYESEKLNIRVYYAISNDYLNTQMEPINSFVTLIMVFILAFGLIITIVSAVIERKNVNKLIKIVDGVLDIRSFEGDDYHRYVEDIIVKVSRNNSLGQEIQKDLIFTKILSFKLSDDELEKAKKYFSSMVCMLMLKNSDEKYTGMERDVCSYLEDKTAEIIHKVTASRFESVFFIKMSPLIKETLEDMIVHINKEQTTDLRGICAVCEDVGEVPLIYEKLRKDIKYLEFGNLKFVKNLEINTNSEEYKNIILKSRQLYEIIKSGNEFEAKRIVYEQWYKITQEEINSEVAETLYFTQTSILSQIITENNLKLDIPKFDSGKDVVSVAFDITECIEQICTNIKMPDKKEDVRISQIVEYINQRYCDSSFYMPELVGKFELSDRAIVQMLKKATGDNFSNLLGKLRIDKAKNMLETTNIPVSEVASASGFDSSNSLYKAFKKVYGVSPSMYRSNRKDEQFGEH